VSADLATTSASVIICCYTHERWDDLQTAIASVLAQSPQPEEVVVVVDHNQGLLERLREAFPAVTAVPNVGAPGLSGARNTGLKLVGTEVVAFLDDDARAETGWLAAHVAAYDDARVIGVGGRLDPLWETARPGWFPHDFDWVVGCTHTGVPTTAAPIRNPIGANMSFRTEVLREVGGFSEDLGRVGSRPLGCEETEASIRVVQRNPGSLVWYAPSAIVEHRVTAERSTWVYFRRRCWAEGVSKASVRRLSQEPLEAERTYVTRTLPRAVVSAIRRAVGGDPQGLPRAGAIVAGFILTSLGYLAGLFHLRLGSDRKESTQT